MSLRPTAVPTMRGWPIARPGLLMAYVGPVLYVYWGPGLDADAERVHLEELARAIDARTGDMRVGVVYEVVDTSGVSAQARSEVARLLNDRRETVRRTTAAYVLVTSAMLMRAGMRAMFWIAPPPYPHATESDLEAALVFVSRHLPELDLARTADQCRALRATHSAELRPRRSA